MRKPHLADPRRARTRALVVSAALAAAVVIAYAGVRSHGFTNLDDPDYVYENPHVVQGLTLAGSRWALTSLEVQNWHPVTWLSHMADVELFGLDAGAHHAVNVALHAANAVLLFLVLSALTAATWRSAAVAALFALHPLHVESVAWIAERKDLLSACLGLLAIGCWVGWARRGRRLAYAGALGAFALSLAAKPMLVTLPFVLLLLDAWPLRRWTVDGAPRAPPAALVLEKLPFLALAAASCAVTLAAQAQGGAIVGRELVPVAVRAGNAVVAYARYVGNTLWPARLSVYYPFPAHGWSIATVAGSALLVAAVTAGCAWQRRTRPWLLVGWLWFLGTLVPVIGLVQVGGQAMADRYTYVPSIGLLLLLVWGAHELAARVGGGSPRWAAAPAAAILAVLALATRTQASHWRDSDTLFTHALAVDPDDWMAQTNLGKAALQRGDARTAALWFEQALRRVPGSPLAETNLGTALARLGRVEEAAALFRSAVARDPAWANGWYNLGVALLQQQRAAEAADALANAVRLEPGSARHRCALGEAMLAVGRAEGAIAQYREAVRLDPTDAACTGNLGVALASTGRTEEALRWLDAALRLDPANAALRANLELARAQRRAPPP